VSSTDRGQVTHIVLILRDLAALTNPLVLIQSLETAFQAIAQPPPGDPGRCRSLATAYRAAGGGVTPIAADARVLSTGKLPASWGGSAGAGAARVVDAAADLLDAVEPALAIAAAGLDAYAVTVEGLQRRHGDLRQRLRDIWNDASHIEIFGVEVAGPDLPHLNRLAQEALETLHGFSRIYEESLSAADELDGRLADCKGRARAALNVAAGNTALNAIVLADTLIGALDRDSAILTTAQAARVADLRGRLSELDRSKLDGLLAGATSPEERAYLMKAFAAGHSVTEIAAFDQQIRAKTPIWLRAHLSLVDPGTSGQTTFFETVIKQFDGTTCGSTSIVIARAMTDPLYALQLTTGGDTDDHHETYKQFGERLAAEEQRTHDSTNTIWPQAIGTAPWGVAGELTDHASSLGTGYDWHLVDDTNPRSVDWALNDAVRSVDDGQPVPVLIGDGYPRHYVLMVGHEGDDLIFYNPSGEVTRISEQDFRDGRMDELGFKHVQGVITPKRG
jgi:hypothetical protein